MVAAIVVAAFLFGKSSGSDVPGIDGPATNASPTRQWPRRTAATPVDPAQVAALMEKITADPKDAASLLALGDLYYTAADYANAADLLREGRRRRRRRTRTRGSRSRAAACNAGDDDAQAFEAWNTVIGLNPDNIEAHYGLGFYYLSQTPADEAKAKAEWQKVDRDRSQVARRPRESQLTRSQPRRSHPSAS